MLFDYAYEYIYISHAIRFIDDIKHYASYVCIELYENFDLHL